MFCFVHLKRIFRSKTGSILIIAIILLFILLTLSLTLVSQEQLHRHMFLDSNLDASRDEAVMVSLERFKETFQKDGHIYLGVLPTSGSYRVATDSYYFTGEFNNSGSVYNPARLSSTNPSSIPEVGYSVTGSEMKSGYRGIPVPPWHSLIVLMNPRASSSFNRYIAVYDSSFPYGVYAPKGGIYLREAVSWANPTLTEFRSHALQEAAVMARRSSQVAGPISYWFYRRGERIETEYVTLPDGRTARITYRVIYNRNGNVLLKTAVRIEYLTNVNVTLTPVVPQDTLSGVPVNMYAGGDIQVTNYPHGRAYSHLGPVDIQGGGLGFSRVPAERDYGSRLRNQVIKAYENLSRDTLDKTKYLFGRPMTPLTVVDGSKGAGEMYTLEQALSVPFPAFTAVLAVPGSVAAVNYRGVFVIHSAHMPDNVRYADNISVIYGASSTGVQLQEPQTRNDETSFIAAGNANTYGISTIASQMTYEKMNEFINSLLAVESDPARQETLVKDLMKNNFIDRRVIHFGKRSLDSYDPTLIKFEKSGGEPTGFSMNATWTIPRGRTLKLKTNMTITGDLWLQEGSVFFVEGNLSVRAPANSGTNGRGPAGRIIIEKGASLLVSGDLLAEGTPSLGSINVVGPLGRIPSLSSSVICMGDVRILNGIYPAVTLQEIALTNRNELLSNHIRDLSYSGPSAAKISGPFHKRQSFLPRYATTLRNLPYGYFFYSFYNYCLAHTIPIENAMSKVFSTTSLAFDIELNSTLGEYLFTHCDWWPFGEGVVPVVPKVNADENISRAFDNFARFLSPSGSGDINSFARDNVSLLADSVLPHISSKAPLLTKTFIRWENWFTICQCSACRNLPNNVRLIFQNNYLNPYFTPLVTAFVDPLTNWRVQNHPDVPARMYPDLESVSSTLFSIVGVELKSHKEKRLSLNESPGVLVYSDKTLNLMGYMSSGFLISRRDLSSSCNRTAGCMISLEGDVKAAETRFLSYPYFTNASLVSPKKVNMDGNLRMLNPEYNQESERIGESVYKVLTEGWDK